MLKDRVLAGAVAGMVASAIKDIPNIILWKMDVVKHLYFYLAASALIDPKQVDTAMGLILGIVVDMITGGSLGIILVFLFKFTGQDYWWFKGLATGSLIWLWGLGISINLGAARMIPLDPLFRITALIEHQIFGFVSAYLVVRWYPENQLKD